MNADLPLVSIVTPSYNYGRFLEDCILSVKNQEYPNIEHIVVDGGSCDNTKQVLEKYQRKYNLRWISERDRGQSDAVNKGFQMAKGQIIGWLNSDDVYFTKNAISYIVNQFAIDPSMDLIYGDNACINERNLILKIRRVPRFNAKRLLRVDYICEPSAFFRRRIIERNKLDVNIDLPMDYEYWLRLIQNGVRFKHVPKILSAERIQPVMKTRSRWEEMKSETKKVQQLYGQKFGPRFSVLKFFDTTLLAFLKIYSIITLVRFYSEDIKQIPFKVEFDSLPKTIWRQSLYI